MASAQDAVRRLTITSTNDGSITKTTSDLNDLAKAQAGVTVASSSTEKATLSLDKQFASIERRYVASVRAQQDYEKTQRQVNAAVAQNPALQDRANVILAAAKDRHDQLTNSQKALTVVSQDLNSRIQAQAGSFGAFGNALTALGPTGLALAATLGTLAAAFYAASAGAHDLAQKSRELKDFSESTGLTVSQVQALRSEASKFGVDSDTLQAGLQKFTTGFQDLRLGSGDLLTQIRRINPALADQMQQATDTASAFTLFGKAVAQTTNIFERNALARAGLGKGGPAVAEFLGNVGDVNALGAAYDAAGRGLKANLIDRLALLDQQIAKTTSKAKENFASVFSESTLQTELNFAQGILKISEAFRDFKFSDDFKRVIDFLTNPVTLTVLGALAAAGGVAALAGGGGLLAGGALGAVGGSLLGAGSYGAISKYGTSSQSGALNDSVVGARAPIRVPIDTTQASAAQSKTPEATARSLNNLVSILGSAASPTERLNAQLAELEVRAKEAGLSGTSELARGLAGLKLDSAVAVISSHNSALGGLATESDIVKQKTLDLAKAQQQGAALSRDQIAAIKGMTEAQFELSKIQQQSQVGVFNLNAANQQAGKELQSWIDQRLLDPKSAEQMAAAQAVLAKRIRDTADAAAVAGSSLPQLTQLGLDAGNLNKQLDAFGTGSLNGLSSSLLDYQTGVKGAKDATKDFEQQFIRSLINMVNQIAILQPIASALKTTLSGIGGMFGGPGNALSSIALPGGGYSSPIGPTVNHTGYGPGDTPGPTRYIHPAYFDNAPRFHSGIGPGERPAIIRDDESVLTPGQMRAMGKMAGRSSGAINVIVNNAPSQPKVSQQQNQSGGRDIMIDFENAVVGAVGNNLAKNGALAKAISDRQSGFKGS